VVNCRRISTRTISRPPCRSPSKTPLTPMPSTSPMMRPSASRA